MVHLRSSLLFAPDNFNIAFSLSAQHHFVAKVAPQGGLIAAPASRYR
jgi:hypothetical protein